MNAHLITLAFLLVLAGLIGLVVRWTALFDVLLVVILIVSAYGLVLGIVRAAM